MPFSNMPVVFRHQQHLDWHDQTRLLSVRVSLNGIALTKLWVTEEKRPAGMACLMLRWPVVAAPTHLKKKI
jgi:hypothetical protein